MSEDQVLELARWAREAEAAVAAKIAAGQLGEAFQPESDNE